MPNLIKENSRVESCLYPGVLWGLTLLGLLWAQDYSFLLFHCLAEGYSIVIACGIFMLAWNTRRLQTNNYLLFLGIAYLFIGGLDLVHMLAYKGMGVLRNHSANPSVQLWIAARFLESVSLLLAPWWIGRKLSAMPLFWIYACIFVFFLAAVFPMDVFPDCYIEGKGLTLFKITSEYIISLLLLTALSLLYLRRRRFDPLILRFLAWSIILTIASEIAFTFYLSVYGISNQIGHYLKIVSFFLIYKAIIQTGLVHPYALLLRNLQQKRENLKAAHDSLELRVKEQTADLLSVSRQLRAEAAEREYAQQELIRANRMLKTLSECNQCLVRATDERTFFDNICRDIVQHGGYGYAAVALTEPNRGFSLRTVAQAGHGAGFLEQVQAAHVKKHPSGGMLGSVLKKREPRVLKSAPAEKDFIAWPFAATQNGHRTAVILPLSSNGDTLGVLVACSDQIDAFDSQQVQLFMELAADVSFGIVTLRMHQQRKAAEAERRLLVSAIEQAGECICITDKDATIEYINPAVENISSFQRHVCLGRPLADLLAANQSFPMRSILRDLKIGKAWNGRIKCSPRENVELDLSIQLSPIKDASQKAEHLVAIIKDITRECQMEQQLFQSQKMEAIGTLAGGIAHDFNNILSAINGFTELTLDQIDKESIGYHNLQEVLKAGQRATALVHQILTFSRQTTPERKPVVLRTIIEEAVKFLRSSLPATISIHLDLHCDGMVLADTTQIHQVLMNLGTNAAHAMAENGGLLTIGLQDETFDAEMAACYPEIQTGPYLKLTVSDTGHGMPRDVMDHIFEPFFTTKTDGQGTGMGLSIVHGIVRNCDGIVTVSSVPSKGSCFTIYLPAIERVAGSQDTEASSIPLGANEHILFIDDEPPLAEIGRQVLESLGYQVTIRTDGSEALELIRAQPDRFDLVVTDMTMPRITGGTLAREIRAIRPRLPVIVCSGFSTQMDEQKAAAMGVRAYIRKPVLKGHLAQVIKEILSKKTGARTKRL